MSSGRRVDEIITYYGKGVTPKYVPHSSIIIINQKCIRNNRIDYSFAQFIDDTKEYNNSKLLRVGDILINSTGQGTAGRVAFVDKIPDGFKLITDSHVLVLRTKSFIESRCLNYSLFAIENLLQTFMDGSTGQGEFDKIRLFNLKVNYPVDHLIQRKICAVFSSIDGKADINKKITAKLEAMARTLYDYWFVQFDFPDKNGKPYRSSGGKMLYDAELKREIPEGWEIKRLGELGELKNGINYDPKETGDCVARIINVRNISKSSIFIDNSDLDELSLNKNNVQKYLVDGKSILIARSGIPGATRLIVDYSKNTIYCGFIINYTVAELIHKLFIFYFLKNLEANLSGQSNGTIMKNVSQQILNPLLISVPPESVLLSFNKVLQPILDAISVNLKQSDKLTQLRDWLLPFFTNGQLKIADVEKENVIVA